MLDISRDIESLSSFKRNTSQFVRQLQETGEPVVLTINGKAALVVQDARSYQKLLELLERPEASQALHGRMGKPAGGQGDGVPQ